MNLREQFKGAPYGGPTSLEIEQLQRIAKLAAEPFAQAARLAHAAALAERRCALQTQQTFRFVYAKWLAQKRGEPINMGNLPF